MTGPARLARTFARATVADGPFHFILFVTARCNARCQMCFYLDEIEAANANLARELTGDEIGEIFRKLGFVPYISLSGGEPFLRRDVFDILDGAARETQPLAISTPTNCSMPERVIETFERLCPRHPHVQFEVQASLDGVGKVHDEVRRVPGLFDKVLETLDGLDGVRAKLPNLRVKLVTTYSAFNHDEVADLVDYAGRRLPFDRMILAWTHGNCGEAAREGLDQARYRQMLARVEALNRGRAASQGPIMHLARLVKKAKEVNRANWEWDQSLGRYCNAGRKIVVLSEQGELRPCEPLAHSMGNVREAHFDVRALMAKGYKSFTDVHSPQSCHCDWGCGQNMAIASHPRFWLAALSPGDRG